MIHAQATKGGVLVELISATNAATATGTMDTLGFAYLTVDVVLGTTNVVSNNPTVLQLLESDDTVATNFVTIAAFTGDETTNGFTIPTGDTAANQLVKMHVNLIGRKRYIEAEISPLTTQLMASTFSLSRAAEMPATAAEAGVDALVIG